MLFISAAVAVSSASHVFSRGFDSRLFVPIAVTRAHIIKML